MLIIECRQSYWILNQIHYESKYSDICVILWGYMQSMIQYNYIGPMTHPTMKFTCEHMDNSNHSDEIVL